MQRRDGPDRTWTPTWEKRGVSDVVAFVFVFSIIITSVGIVSAFGFGALRDIQNDEQAVNAVRGMEALGHNLGNIQRGHAPGRTGELKLSDGTVYVEEQSEMAVVPVCSGSPGCNHIFTFDMGTLYYDMDDSKTRVAVESGGVFRQGRQGSPVVVDEPRFMCGPDYAVVSVVTLRSDGSAPGGQGTVQVIGRERETRLHFANDTVARVEVTPMDTEFGPAWESYFDSPDNGWTFSGGVAECSFSAGGKVFIRQTIIEIEFVT